MRISFGQVLINTFKYEGDALSGKGKVGDREYSFTVTQPDIDPLEHLHPKNVTNLPLLIKYSSGDNSATFSVFPVSNLSPQLTENNGFSIKSRETLSEDALTIAEYYNKPYNP